MTKAKNPTPADVSGYKPKLWYRKTRTTTGKRRHLPAKAEYTVITLRVPRASASWAATQWQPNALCRGSGEDSFYPPKQRYVFKAIEDAVGMCHQCPVRRECLAYAVGAEWGSAGSVRAGVWGGLTPGQRHRLELDGKVRITTTCEVVVLDRDEPSDPPS